MAIIRWRDPMDPFTDIGSLRNAVNQVFGDFMVGQELRNLTREYYLHSTYLRENTIFV